MHIVTRHATDVTTLKRYCQQTSNAKQRDRYRAVLLALEGHTTPQIRAILGRSKNFVQRWNYAYRDGGIEALCPLRQTGRPPKLPREEELSFKQRVLAGPTASDQGLCTLRGKDAMRILKQEFGVPYSLDGVYDLLHRLGLSCLKPRPKHRKNNPQAMQQWLNDAPLLSSTSKMNTPTGPSKSGFRTKRGSASKEH
jgi:transposase